MYAIRLYNRRLTKAELARNHRIDCKRFLTSSSYIQEGLTAHWDGIDNVGRGQHDSTARTWKNLVPGGLDLTLSTGIWTDESLMSIGKSDLAATGTAYQAFNSVEVVFANAKHNTSSIMFNTGLANRYFALGGQFCMFRNYYATTNSVNRYSKGRYSASGIVSTDNDAIYINGANVMSGTHGDQWGVVDAYVQIGGRSGSNNAYAYNGDIFAIRTYSNTLNANKVAYNYKVDRRRFGLDAQVFTWNAGDGIFTSANWTTWKQATANVPGASDAVVLPAGDYTVTLDGDTVVEALSVGAGAKLKMTLPFDAGATDMKMLTVFGGATAASGAGIVLDAQAFDRKHANKSITIVECDNESAASLATLAANMSFVNDGNSNRHGKASVSADGRRLVYTAPSKPGMMIIVL